MNLTVDASVFVAAARTEEVYYLASRQFLQQVRTHQCDLFCPSLVLPECAAAIARPTGSATLAEILVSLVETFPRLQLMSLDLSIATRAARLAMDFRLRGADSLYVSVAETCGATLVTWDVEMLERGAGAVTTMTPQMWIEIQPARE